MANKHFGFLRNNTNIIIVSTMPTFSGLVADGCGVGGVSFGGVEGRRK